MLITNRKDLYHELLTCTWSRFFIALLALFLSINVVFSFTFMIFNGSFIPPAHLANHSRFVSGLFLSIQTMSTIGYGGILPTSLAGEMIAAFESLVGLMFTALSTGMIFARLSRPSANIIFAECFLHTMTDDGPALVFRVANGRGNEIINATATLHVIDMSHQTSQLNMYRVHELVLRRQSTPTFYLNWMLVHNIDEESPLYQHSSEHLTGPHMTYILNIVGHDSSFNQTVFQYYRYQGTQLIKDVYFKDMIQIDPSSGKPQINLEHISEVVRTE